MKNETENLEQSTSYVQWKAGFDSQPLEMAGVNDIFIKMQSAIKANLWMTIISICLTCHYIIEAVSRDFILVTHVTQFVNLSNLNS